VRVGGRLRIILAPGAPTPDGLADMLRARGIGVRWIRAVEPSVEDLFVSFVDKERKARVREQLRALAATQPVGGLGAGGDRGGSIPPHSNDSAVAPPQRK